jgi:hypothetical protein
MNTETQIQLLQSAITQPHAELIILCDLSGSMSAHIDPANPNSPTRRQILRQCLLSLAHTLQAGARIYRFAGDVKPFQSFHEQEFAGWDLAFGTDIEKALRVARKHNPARIIVITDGSPTESTAEETIATAQAIFTRIDTYYCGNQSDEAATSLCRQLAQYGGECIIDPSGANMLHDLTLLLC